MNIVLGICGSIAAYKAIEVAKLLIKNEYNVDIVLSKSAINFLSPLTLNSLFPKKVFLSGDDLGSEDEMLHIVLAKKADIVLISPCSANMIAKLANGDCSCLLTSLCVVTKAKIVIAPAMNVAMWENSIVQSNISKLKAHGVFVINPESGVQACGDDGIGRMPEPINIIEYVDCIDLIKIDLLKDKKILVTAGATKEKIDPVRFISNYSSGKMGYSIAKAAQMLGAEVVLISGQTCLNTPNNFEVITVESTQQMLDVCLNKAQNCDAFIAAAAVADYKLITLHLEKIKKTSNYLNLKFEENPDIVFTIKKTFPNLFCLGFAAETNNHINYGKQKLKTKNLDAIAINDISDGEIFNNDYNELIIITKNNENIAIKKNKKIHVAFELLSYIANVI